MTQEGNILEAEKGHTLVRTADNLPFGAKIYLGKTWYVGGVKLPEPKQEEAGDFFEREMSDAEIVRHAISTFAPEKAKEGACEMVDAITDRKILEGFRWRGIPVWLSTEAQFNYKSAYDLAVQNNGATLPVTFKIGTTTEPVFVEFSTLDELRPFIMGIFAHINSLLEKGWKRKSAIMELIDAQASVNPRL